MYTYNLNKKEGALYYQLYRCILEDIRRREIQPGDKLPSKRSLADHLGVSAITVENAYQLLMDEELVISYPKRGYFVSKHADLLIKENQEAHEIVKVQTNNEIKYEFDFSSNRPEEESFPFSTFAKQMRYTVSMREHELMMQSPSNGIYEFREAIAGHLRSFRGMSVDASQIVIGAGTEYLYGLLIQLLGRDLDYCLENPGYEKLAKIYRSNETKVSYANLDEHGIRMDELRNLQPDVVHISPTHHFPTGITMSLDRRRELLDWAMEKDGRYIIEDDYDSEFRVKGRPLPTLQSIDREGRVIYMNTFSKSLTSTIRISYAVLPPRLMERFLEKLSFYSCTVSNFEQYTLADFIRKGYFERHINRMRRTYGKRRERVLQVTKEVLGDKGTIMENEAGLHFVLQLQTTHKDEYIIEELRKRKIHITAITEYDVSPKKKDLHQFLIQYSNISEYGLHSALEYLKSIL